MTLDSSRQSDIPTADAWLRTAIDDIANQLCLAVDGDFDFAVHASLEDETLEKLAMLTNFVLEAARRGMSVLREHNEALGQLDRAKTAFFSNISHEFRTPLTLMLGPIEDALESRERALTGESLASAHRNALRLLKMVNTLLDFSRLEAGRLEAVYQPTDLGAFTAEIASVFRAATERAGLRLTVDSPPLSKPVYVDRDMWERIVLNLLSNALKFTFEGEIAVAVHAGDDRAQLLVRDTGIGIPESEVPRLFERFHRIEGARSRSHEGSGIGLALVQELVRLHGGSIEVSSVHGKGTEFTVSLPFGSAHLSQERIGGERSGTAMSLGAAPYLEEASSWASPAAAHPATSSPQPAGAAPARPSGGRIVLADDNADLRAYVGRLLSREWSVESVADGSAALEAIRRDPPDLILSDIMMPGIDGNQLLREIRNDPQTRTIPVVLLSARAGEEARVEGLEAGADDYLVKPFSARELVARVRTHLELSRLRTHAAVVERIRALISEQLDAMNVLNVLVDETTALLRAECGAFFRKDNQKEERYTLVRFAGAPRDAFPSVITPETDFSTAGHPPMRSQLLIPVVLRSGEIFGRLLFAHPDEAAFDDFAERVAGSMAAHAAAAIDTARLYATLEEERRRYRSLVLATPTRQAIGVSAGNGMVEEDSPSWREITGQTLEQMLGRGWLDAVHQDDRSRVEQAWDEAIVASRLFECEYRLRMTDGAYRWFSGKAVPVFGTSGAVTEWVGTTTDIHDHHIAQEGLRFLAKANELFAASLDYEKTLETVTLLAVPKISDWCAVDLVDESRQQLYRRVAMAHVNPDKVELGHELHKKYPPDPATDEIWNVIQSGRSRLVPAIEPGMLAKVARDGEHQRILETLGLLSWMIVPLHTRGEVLGAVTFVSTERRFGPADLVHAEEFAHRAAVAIENARLYGAAQSASRAKDAFLATLSHELRTPMTAVLGWARMLKLGLDEQQSIEAVDAIEKSAEVQAQLIEDVLDVSRIISGKLTFQPRAVDLRTVAAAAVTTVQPTAAAKSIAIDARFQDALPPIAGDEGRLQQVVWNLLSNAIKFTDKGGRVTIAIEAIGSIVRLTVQDTGRGIAPQFLPHVFEAFRQEDSSTTRAEGGIGLGLAIVKTVVELHGGRITARSEGVGHGSAFIVELPVLESPSTFDAIVGVVGEKAPSQRVSVEPTSLHGMRVLVIDDQEYTRDVIVAVVRRSGAVVHPAASVREGLEVFHSIRPDVVVCDIAMPQQDGYAFLRAVRAEDGAASRTPIIALTAFGRPEDRQNALNAGFDAYLTKPVEPVDLAETILRIQSARLESRTD